MSNRSRTPIAGRSWTSVTIRSSTSFLTSEVEVAAEIGVLAIDTHPGPLFNNGVGGAAGIGLEAARFRAGLKEGAAGRSKKQPAAVQAVPLQLLLVVREGKGFDLEPKER